MERRRGVLAAGAVLAIVAAGCGGGGGHGAPTPGAAPPATAAALVARAGAVTVAGGPVHLVTATAYVEDGEARVLRVEGDADLRTGRHDLTVRLEGLAHPPVPELGQTAVSEVRSDGTTQWWSLADEHPFGGEPTAEGRHWVSAPASADPTRAEVGFTSSDLAFAFDTRALDEAKRVLDPLTAVVGDVRADGTDRSGGAATTRYVVTFDLDKVQRLTIGAGEPVEPGEVRPDVAATFPGEVWLDEAGRVRHLMIREDLAPVLTPAALSVRASDPSRKDLVVTRTVDLTPLGHPVVVAAPPIGDTVAATVR